MTVPAGVEGQGGAGDTPPVQPEGTPPTPEQQTRPYDEHLAKLPESVRPLVEPIFQEWDSGVTRQFQELHQQYDPWKPVLDAGYQPDVVQQSLQLVQTLEQQPEQVLMALAQAYGVELAKPEEPAAPVTPEPQEDEDTLDPRLKQHEEMLQTMGQYLLQQQQEAKQREEDAALENTLSSLKQQHGDFNERYVLALMAQGATPEQAVTQFKADLQQFTADQKAADAPVVVGAGGGIPATPTDPSQLNSKDTKNLVVQLLQQAKANS